MSKSIPISTPLFWTQWWTWLVDVLWILEVRREIIEVLKSQNLLDTMFSSPGLPRNVIWASFALVSSLGLFSFYFLLASNKLILSCLGEPREIKKRYFILAWSRLSNSFLMAKTVVIREGLKCDRLGVGGWKGREILSISSLSLYVHHLNPYINSVWS